MPLDALNGGPNILKVTDWLAIYAAVLSTVVFAWNVLRAKPKVKTRLTLGLHPEQGPGVYVFVQNKSGHTVHLAAVGPLYRSGYASIREKLAFIIKYRRFPKTLGWVHTSFKYFGISDACPVAIEAGNAHQIFVPEAQVEEILRGAEAPDLMAHAQDMLWRNSYSNVLVYPLSKSSAGAA